MIEMTDIIDLNERRNAADKPDGDFVRKDDYGRPLFFFLLDYEMDGGHWGAEIWAYSAEDAEARVLAMRGSLTVMGQVFTTVPA